MNSVKKEGFFSLLTLLRRERTFVLIYIRNTTNLFYVYVYSLELIESPYYLLLDLFFDFLYFDPRLLLHLL